MTIDEMMVLYKSGHGSVKKICEANGLDYFTTYWRWRRAGWKGVGGMTRRVDKRPGRPSAPWIVSWVADKHGLALEAMTGDGRRAPVVHVRRIACVLLDHAGYSTPVIARAIGRRDHTTVLHHLDVAAERMARDAGYARHIRTLKAELDALSDDAT